jgi:hypothetical protein
MRMQQIKELIGKPHNQASSNPQSTRERPSGSRLSLSVGGRQHSENGLHLNVRTGCTAPGF